MYVPPKRKNKAESCNTGFTTLYMLKQTYLFEGSVVFTVLFRFKASPDAGVALWDDGLRTVRREERRPFGAYKSAMGKARWESSL